MQTSVSQQNEASKTTSSAGNKLAAGSMQTMQNSIQLQPGFNEEENAVQMRQNPLKPKENRRNPLQPISYSNPFQRKENTQNPLQPVKYNNPFQRKESGQIPFQGQGYSTNLLQPATGIQPFQRKEAPPEQEQPVLQPKKENNTGLPDNLKEGVEALSGYSMDDVKVHYNSDKPAQLQALAYAQGTDIHIAPGQEQHLPHEAWHVVQQKQGRVQPTVQMKQDVAVNDDKGLEKEADEMGKQLQKNETNEAVVLNQNLNRKPGLIQRKIGLEFQSDAAIYHSESPKFTGREKKMTSYGYKLFQYSGLFHIESDDGEVEFVTEAFEEDNSGFSNLLTAVAQAANFAQLIKNTTSKPADSFDEKKKNHQFLNMAEAFGGNYTNQSPEGFDLYIGAGDKLSNTPDMIASPQASVGIKLELLGHLFNSLRNDKKIGGKDSRITTSVYHSEKIVREDLLGNDNSGNEDSLFKNNGKLRGFVTLIIAYLRGAAIASPELDANNQKNKSNYPKMAHPVMARNNFRDIFLLLSQREQDIFIDNFKPQKLIELANLSDYNEDTPIYSEGYFSDENEPVDKSKTPTVKAWWNSITNNSEKNTKDALSQLPGQLKGRGMGQLDKMDTVPKENHKGAGEKMPVFELRAMEKSIPFEEWVDLAKQVFMMVHSVNENINDGEVLDPKINDVEKLKSNKAELNNSFNPEYY